MPGVALACEATIVVAGAGGDAKIARATSSPVGCTVLEASEILLVVRFPSWPAKRRWAFEEFARRKGDFALAGVALYYDLGIGARVAGPPYCRLRRAEHASAFIACADARQVRG